MFNDLENWIFFSCPCLDRLTTCSTDYYANSFLSSRLKLYGANNLTTITTFTIVNAQIYQSVHGGNKIHHNSHCTIKECILFMQGQQHSCKKRWSRDQIQMAVIGGKLNNYFIVLTFKVLTILRLIEEWKQLE